MLQMLNNKKQREKYKAIVNRQRQVIGETKLQKSEPILERDSETISTGKCNIISLNDDGGDEDEKDSSVVSMVEQTKSSLLDSCGNLQMRFPPQNNSHATTQTQEFQPIKGTCQSSQTESPKKRARSCSPIANSNTEDNAFNEKRFKMESPQFYKKINEMFPTFEGLAKQHVECISNNSLIATENKLKVISSEIKTLNEILHAKEMDLNRILHLKAVKKEIYTRLLRKKEILEITENLGKTYSQKSLMELKDLELYLSENSNPTNTANSTIQQIIENRANMKTEDLEREKNNTSRLHSLLVSQNILPDMESIGNKICTNGDINRKSHVLNAEQRHATSIYLNTGYKDLKQNTLDNVSKIQYYNAYVEDANNKMNIKKLGMNSPKNSHYPYCQECKIHESRFVCAGCGNQWYCSKECQITAWDKHSEICTE
ncbi:uncharacterized protein LOC142235616 [Haematobia irritans]|uniref:uncharacterized protein LOC142235616 n=1 Tax=Haematobia irritans TaxID=7368 RepID=UPI003F4F5ABC